MPAGGGGRLRAEEEVQRELELAQLSIRLERPAVLLVVVGIGACRNVYLFRSLFHDFVHLGRTRLPSLPPSRPAQQSASRDRLI
jgi:hypothetical protein